jgi:hypothetical protein
MHAACVVINCGQGGHCKKGAGFSYQCRCQPGFKNLLNDTSMPCIGGSCKIVLHRFSNNDVCLGFLYSWAFA